MNKSALKLIVSLHELILAIALLSIFATSFYVAKNIYALPEQNKVLGASIPNTNNKFLVTTFLNSDDFKLNFSEDKSQINFGLRLKNKGMQETLIPLGRLYNTARVPQNYRLAFNLAEVYKNDMNVYMVVDNNQYDLVVNGKHLSNNFVLPQNSDVKIYLKIQPLKNIYYQYDSEFVIYK